MDSVHWNRVGIFMSYLYFNMRLHCVFLILFGMFQFKIFVILAADWPKLCFPWPIRRPTYSKFFPHTDRQNIFRCVLIFLAGDRGIFQCTVLIISFFIGSKLFSNMFPKCYNAPLPGKAESLKGEIKVQIFYFISFLQLFPEFCREWSHNKAVLWTCPRSVPKQICEESSYRVQMMIKWAETWGVLELFNDNVGATPSLTVMSTRGIMGRW